MATVTGAGTSMSDAPAEAPLERVMVIYAHPDDPEFFSGGLLARFAADGKEIIYVLATSGDKGTDDPDITPQQLASMREAEQRAAAKCLNVETVVFLRYPDGELMPTLGLRRDLTRLIRQFKPDIVVTNDPQTYITRMGSINHPDHRAIGDATLSAIYPTARDRHNMVELWRDEGLEPHKVRRVYLSGTLNPNMRLIISDVLETKITAILEHRSQIKDREALIKRMRESLDTEFDDQPLYTESYRVLNLK
ncbi:MAG: PIG-L family deacetylase [Anaerolineae bacterium]|nr:PIG-L family deacetylase [Anaerolineae bacterium]